MKFNNTYFKHYAGSFKNFKLVKVLITIVAIFYYNVCLWVWVLVDGGKKERERERERGAPRLQLGTVC